MRVSAGLLSLNVAIAGPGKSGCEERPIKLWISHDMTASFEEYAHEAKSFITNLVDDLEQSFPQLEWGYSGFKDRSEDDGCYFEATDFTETSNSEKITKVVKMLEKIGGGGDGPEDSLSSIPYLAKQKFGAYVDQTGLRLLLLLTDQKGKYHPHFISGFKPLPDPTQEVVCDKMYHFPTLDQVFSPMKQAGIIFIVLLPKKEENVAKVWRSNLDEAGVKDYTIQTVKDVGDPAEVANMISTIVQNHSCDEVTTTTTSTSTTTTTTAKTTTTTSTTTTATTTTPTTTTSTTTTATTTTPTTTTSTTTTATTTTPTTTTPTTATATTTTPTTTTPTTATATTTTPTTTSSTASTTEPTEIPTVSPTASPSTTTTPESDKNPNIGAIVGGSIGGLAVVGLLGAAAQYYSQPAAIFEVGEEVPENEEHHEQRESAVQVDEREFADF